MSNLYERTQKIYELLPKINQKYGLEIKVESAKNYYKLSKDSFMHKKDDIIIAHSEDIDYIEDGGAILDIEGISRYSLITGDNYSLVYSVPEFVCPVLKLPQIRQILIGLKKVLGENPEYKQDRWLLDNLNKRYENKELTEYSLIACLKSSVEKTPKSQAEALCQKWLDGLEPLFDREPETVLQELIEILENLLK